MILSDLVYKLKQDRSDPYEIIPFFNLQGVLYARKYNMNKKDILFKLGLKPRLVVQSCLKYIV